MKRFKNVIKFVAAIALLMVIPMVPLTVSQLQDNKMLGQLQVEKVKNESNHEMQVSKLNIEEKLALISDYKTRVRNIVVTNQIQDMSEENVTKIKMIIIEQLTVMKGLGILKDFDFNETYVCRSYILKRYRNIVDVNENVSVYQLAFLGEEGSFEVWLDADTNKIYQYSYVNKQYITSNDELLFVFGTEYLGLDKESVYRYLYSNNEARMNAVSIASYEESY